MNDSLHNWRICHGHNYLNSCWDHNLCFLYYSPWYLHQSPIEQGSHSPFTGVRVGEAKKPGPFTLAALNVQALSAFVSDRRILDTSSDIRVFSETAATAHVIDQARKVLLPKGQSLVATEPCPKRSFADGRTSNLKGTAEGVMIVSTRPLRPVRREWSQYARESRRVVDTYVVNDDAMIYVAGIYGHHQGHQGFAEENNKLLSEVLERASARSGPAAILGDVNMCIEDLAIWAQMRSMGWVDLAVHQASIDGAAPSPTFGEISRLDYVLVNPLLLQQFQSFQVSTQPETDHKTVWASFSQHQSTTIRCPKLANDLRSTQLQPHQLQSCDPLPSLIQKLDSALEDQNVEAAWSSFAAAFEQAADRAARLSGKGPLPTSHRGRGSFHLQNIQAHEPVIKHARHGEFEPSGEESTVKLRQRVRQIRRVSTLVSQLNSIASSEVHSPKTTIAAADTWRAVVNAKGFQPSFPEWWVRETEQPFLFQVPDSNMAQSMLDTLKRSEKHWRAVTMTKRRQVFKRFFDDDWQAGGSKRFLAVKDPPLPVVNSVDQLMEVPIKLCRRTGKGHMKFTVIHEDLQLCTSGCILQQGKALAVITSVSNSVVSAMVSKGVFKSGNAQIARPTADVHAVVKQAGSYWRTYWDAIPPDYQVEQCRKYVEMLPQLPELDTEFSLQELRAVLHNLQVKKARGPDAWGNFDLKFMPESLIPRLLRLLNLFTTLGCWPESMRHAKVHLLAKSQEVRDVSSTRPITIVSTVFRVWARLVTARVFKHIKGSLPGTLFGSVPGKSITDLFLAMQLQMETASVCGTDWGGGLPRPV